MESILVGVVCPYGGLDGGLSTEVRRRCVLYWQEKFTRDEGHLKELHKTHMRENELIDEDRKIQVCSYWEGRGGNGRGGGRDVM